jgi:hypothetical protein
MITFQRRSRCHWPQSTPYFLNETREPGTRTFMARGRQSNLTSQSKECCNISLWQRAEKMTEQQPPAIHVWHVLDAVNACWTQGFGQLLNIKTGFTWCWMTISGSSWTSRRDSPEPLLSRALPCLPNRIKKSARYHLIQDFVQAMRSTSTGQSSQSLVAVDVAYYWSHSKRFLPPY